MDPLHLSTPEVRGKNKGDIDTALKYHEDALKIFIKFKIVYGKDIVSNAIKKLRN